NVEEQRVELIHVINETATVTLKAPMPQTPFKTPRGNLLDAISTRSQVVPQFSQVLRLGITASHSDDGNILRLTRPLTVVCRWMKSSHRGHSAGALGVLCALCGWNIVWRSGLYGIC